MPNSISSARLLRPTRSYWDSGIVAWPKARCPGWTSSESKRTGSGRVVPLGAYDERGMIPADTLNPQKARVLLMLALTRTRDLDEIRRMFSEY